MKISQNKLSPVKIIKNNILSIVLILLVTLIIYLIIKIIFPKSEIENFTKNKLPVLGIQTVFIAKENIPFLREWIEYHLNIGFSKFFLYDNTGSIGCDGSNNTQNKYNINYNDIIKISDQQVTTELQKIISDYPNNIFYIKWQPKNEKGEIIYGQNESFIDFYQKYRNQCDYTAFIDIDEFIYSPSNINIPQFIQQKSNDNINKLILKQKKFTDRFCYLNKKVIEIDDCIDNINTSGWAVKLIIKNQVMKPDVNNGIHNIEIITGNTEEIPEETLRFNHYNVNKKQIDWMKGFFKQDNFDFGKDSSLSKYHNLLSKLPDTSYMIDQTYLNQNIPLFCKNN